MYQYHCLNNIAEVGLEKNLTGIMHRQTGWRMQTQSL